MEVREQAGHGAIDISLQYRNLDATDDDHFTGWVINNQQLTKLRFVAVPPDCRAFGMTVKEQAGFGVIDVRFQLMRKDGSPLDDPFTGWACQNPEAGVTQDIHVPHGKLIRGLGVMEQAGYGVVDVRLSY